MAKGSTDLDAIASTEEVSTGALFGGILEGLGTSLCLRLWMYRDKIQKLQQSQQNRRDERLTSSAMWKALKRRASEYGKAT